MSKKSTFIAMVIALLFAVASFAAAREGQNAEPQTTLSSPPQEYGRGRHGGMDATKRTEELTKQLTLSADQQEKVQGILRQEQTSMQNLRQDSSLSQQDRRAKTMDIRSTSAAQIRALLNEQQQQKWDKMQNSHEQHGWGHHHDAGSDRDNAPSSNAS